MAVRIYALAKQLKIDSKKLVDVCNKAGVRGKGSALASLDDDELAKVKSFLAGGATGGKSATRREGNGSGGAITREDYVAPTGADRKGKPKVLAERPRPALKKDAEPPVPVEDSPQDASATAVEEAPTAPAAPSDTSATASPSSETPPVEADQAGESSPLQTEGATGQPPASEPPDQQPPSGDAAPPARPSDPDAPQRPRFQHPDKKVINRDAHKPDRPKTDKPKGDQKPQQKRGPVVRVAAIPKAKDPPKPAAKKDEPAPQKPIMTLPKDAIRGAKEGSKAPLEQFTRQTDKKRKPGGGGKDDSAVEDRAAGKGGKDRRGVRDREDGLAGMSGSRAARQQGRRARATQTGDDDSDRRRQRGPVAAPRKGKVTIQLPCTVRSFSEATGVPTAQVQRVLMGLGTMANINAEIEPEMAELVATELELDYEFRVLESLEDTLLKQIRESEDPADQLQPRPPVVTFLGHVDHGKTSLLDRVIGIDVVSSEAGGITQHIRAYSVEKDGRSISFVDTPGHEAFTEMRARGATVTDIAVLVIAADDGIMPQTEEAISHAQAAEVPIVVALNKIDLPGANVDRVLQQLSGKNLLPAEWGGEIEVVKTSAITGEGIDDLLETLLLTAEIHEYKANPSRPAFGTSLEAQQEADRGVVAKVMVQNGTLRVGDVVVCGTAYGRVKAMHDCLQPQIKLQEAPPSTPLNLIGLDVAPEAGESFYVLSDIAQAREIAATRDYKTRTSSLGQHTIKVSFEDFQRRLEEGRLGDTDDVATLNLIIRADVRGSLEAIQKELDKFEHPEVRIKILQATVGGVTVADVTLADASKAVIAGFNVIPDETARRLADDRGVEIRRYDIIYKLTEDIKLMLEGKLKPEEQVVDLGRALVLQTFSISKVGTIAGCRVLAGTIERGCRIRVNRDGRGIGDYPLDSLKREKDDVKEVREGYECGIKLSGFNDVKEGDVLEAYRTEEVGRKLQ